MEHSMRLNATSKRIAEDRYFNDNEKMIADTKTLEEAYMQMCSRVANSVAAAEKTPMSKEMHSDVFTQAMYNQDMIPAGRFWANAGGENQQFPNCFVYAIKDTKVNGKDGIFDTLSLAAVTASGGGGTGFDFSRLRSRGIPTTKSKGVSSGPVAFIKSYDAIMENIRQGGTRRAANMGILRVDHPDILEFIFLKDKTQKFKRFNLSVAITDAFMKSLHEYPDKHWIVRDPKTQEDYAIFIPCDINTKNHGTLDFLMSTHSDVRGDKIPNYMLRELVLRDTLPEAKEGFYVTPQVIWDCITYNAWYCGDPGVFFIDIANASNCLITNTYDILHCNYIRATNPCGEEAMEDNAICMLTSINLANFVITSETDSNIVIVDFKKLRDVTKIAVRFLDNALDVSTYPSELVKQQALNTRRIGIGVMGWADMLIKLGVTYGSTASLKIAGEVMGAINEEALSASIALGKERGNFPLFAMSNYATGERGFPKLKSLRNAYRTMVAPTGTTSLLTGVNESIEPVFRFHYERKDGTGVYKVENYLYKEWTLININGPMPNYFVTTNDVPYLQHIDMQASFQRHVDVSISKTINMPSDATVADVSNAYLHAYESKCKGTTVYRDKSKDAQVLNAPSLDKATQITHPVTREEGILAGLTWKVRTGDGTCFISINKNGEGKPVEVFIRVGKAGSDINAYSEALGRIISISLQHKIAPEAITKQLIGILGDSPIFHKVGKYHKVLSVPDAVGKVLEEFSNKSSYLMYSESSSKEVLKEETVIKSANLYTDYEQKRTAAHCTVCQQQIYESEGCKVCGCGSSCDE